MAKSRARYLAELLGATGLVKRSRSALSGEDETIDLDALPTIPNSQLEHSSVSIAGHTLSLGGSLTLNTADIGEHASYLYYTDARARSAISVTGAGSYNSTTGVITITGGVTSVNSQTGAVSLDTDDVAEGLTNLYYTDARARSAISVTGSGSYNSSTGVITITGGVSSVNSQTGAVSLDTDDVAEGLTNLYYTDARVGSYLTTNSYATQSYVSTAISNLVDAAPSTLDTLNELAAALGDDANFSTTVTNSIATKWTQDNTKISNWDTAYGWGNHASAGYLTGNQTITLSGDVSGSGTTSIVVTVANDSHTHDSRYYTESEIDTRMDYTLYSPQSAIGGNLNSLSHYGWYTWGGSAPTNAPDNYGFALYTRDGSQDQQIVQTYGGSSNKVSLYGRRKTSGSWDTVWTQYFSDHYHPNADKWTTSRTLSLSGDASGSVSWDGSANATLTVTVADDSHNHTHSDGGFTVNGNLVVTGDVDVGAQTGTWIQSDVMNDAIGWNTNYGVYIGSNVGGTHYLRGNGTFTTGGSTYNLWHTGNDGSGSGLDADLLDGIQASSFLRSDTSDTFNGILTVNTTSDAQIQLTSSNTWTGIGFNDSGSVNEYIWYNGQNGTFAIGGGGSNVSGKKLHVDGGMSVGSTADGTSTPTNGIYSQGQISVGGSTVWHAGNDGSGSGLDADTVDGIHASSFMRNDATNHEIRFDNEEYDFSWTAHSQINPLSLKVWNNYAQSGAPSTYGTLLDIYGYSGHAHNQIHFDANSYTMRLRYGWYGSNAWSSWATLWNSANDGSGSGLDADTVDGLQGSALARTNAVASIDMNNYSITNLNDLSFNDPGPNEGIAWLSGNGWKIYESPNNLSTNSAGNLQFVTGSTRRVTIDTSGNLTAITALYAPRMYDSDNTNYSINPNGTTYYQYSGRLGHNTGHQVGSYNSVGANGSQSNPIYSIGSNYNPSTTSLSNFYGIGYTNLDASFITAGNGWGLYVAADGDARIFLSGTNGGGYFNGDVTAYASDERLKENIKPIENALEKVLKLNGVEFDWKDEVEDLGFIPSTKHETGVIAQNVQEVVPDAVVPAPFNDEYLTVNKEKIIPLLIEAIKEQQKLIEELQKGVQK